MQTSRTMHLESSRTRAKPSAHEQPPSRKTTIQTRQEEQQDTEDEWKNDRSKQQDIQEESKSIASSTSRRATRFGRRKHLLEDLLEHVQLRLSFTRKLGDNITGRGHRFKGICASLLQSFNSSAACDSWQWSIELHIDHLSQDANENEASANQEKAMSSSEKKTHECKSSSLQAYGERDVTAVDGTRRCKQRSNDEGRASHDATSRVRPTVKAECS